MIREMFFTFVIDIHGGRGNPVKRHFLVFFFFVCIFFGVFTNEIGKRHESPGPALPDVPATVVHQVEHLSPLQV